MNESSPIKDTLYAEIDEIGQDQIHDLLKERKFSELFEKIFDSAINKIESDMNENEKYGTLAESFTHYLFTEMLIPSQRKILFEDVELDMIIPNTAELKKNINNILEFLILEFIYQYFHLFGLCLILQKLFIYNIIWIKIVVNI